MKKKSFGLLLTLVLSVGTAACSSNTGKSATNSPAGSAAPSSSASASASPANPYAKKLTISSFEGIWAAVPETNGPGNLAINEKFNVEFKPQFVSMDQAAQKASVLMASGDMPDFIGGELEGANFVKWAKQGAFLPLNDYIDKYPVFKLIPKSAWNGVTVDGKIYGIPRFFTTKYGNAPIIRKDWLDKLNLKMPTNYNELLEVAKAFTTRDPDGNGKDDTYGFVMAKGLDNEMTMGSGYNSMNWSYKNEKGQYIPNIIADAGKERIQFLRDAYAAGVVPKDWPVQTYKDNRKVFYDGKAGIYYEGTPGNSGLFNQLLKADPNAVVVPIPPFKAPDGSQAQTGLKGWYTLYALSSKLKDSPDKVDRIMRMINYFTTFIEPEKQNDTNPDFDWQWGGVGKAYTMENGIAKGKSGADSMMPKNYMPTAQWAPSDEALKVETKAVGNAIWKAYAEAAVKMWSQPGITYLDPTYSISSDLLETKYWELQAKIIDEQTKMIVGNSSMDQWNNMVQTFLKNGGQEVIDDVNKKIQEVGAKPTFK